mmetsp:Transcript_36258/g.90253  ORF Transcript_36258/g.90253 Transcript_36258/m.90253 type:complete len:108 (-) Transcript_36258:218-541(-)
MPITDLALTESEYWRHTTRRKNASLCRRSFMRWLRYRLEVPLALLLAFLIVLSGALELVPLVVLLSTFPLLAGEGFFLWETAGSDEPGLDDFAEASLLELEEAGFFR